MSASDNIEWHVWKPRRGFDNQTLDRERCAGSVTHYQGNWPSHHQCSKKGKHEEGGYLWCGTHKPSNVAARKAERERQWRAAADRAAAFRQAARDEAALKDAALDALRKIAEGHNDPRGLALEILGQRTPEA